MIPDPADTPRPYWIEKALASLINLSPAQLVCAGNRPWGAPPMKSGPKPELRYSTGPHAHPFAEVCIALDGNSSLELGEQRYRVTPPMVAVIEPQVSHCEGCFRHDRNYALMWMSVAGASLSSNVITYTLSRGWKSKHMFALRSTPGERLFSRFTSDDPWMRRSRFETIRQDLLATLCDLYIQASQYGTPSSTANSIDRHKSALEHVKAVLDEQATESVAVARLAETVNLTPNYLNTLFNRWTGESIYAYQQRRRLDLAMQLLRDGELLVKEVAGRLGYRDAFYFSRAFHKQFGVRPSQVKSW